MIRSLLPVLLAALAAPGALLAQPDGKPERIDAPALPGYKVILVGDSTTAPHSGWGGAFCAHHVKWRIACLNLARGSRSTRSYRAEGTWDVALGEMKVPGYEKTWVLIQFGHNDAARNKPERWTEAATEFPDNLRRFVQEARVAHAIPILVTPLSRREFKDGKLDNTLASWSEQVRGVAGEMKVPLIDLNARSAGLAQRLGPVAAMEFAQGEPGEAEKAAAARGTTLPVPPNPPNVADDKLEKQGKAGARGHYTPKFDYTHLGDQGAEVHAKIVAEELGQLAPELGAMIIP